MNDVMGDNQELDQEMTDIESAPETPPVPARRRARWFHVVALAVAVLVAAAGIGFFVSQSSDRDDATNQRRAAQAALASQRGTTEQARTTLATDRSASKKALDSVSEFTTLVHELSDLTSQEVDADNAGQQLAVTNPDAVDQYNAQAEQANAIIDLMNQKAQQIQALADKLEQEGKAQTAAFVR